MNGYTILVFVISVIYKVTATFPMSPFAMGLGGMHMGSPFGFGGMGFPMPVLKKIYNPLTNTFIVKPFLVNPHMAMGMRQPFMFNPFAMNMMRPPLAPMGFGHMGHMGGMGPRPMGMGMGFPARYPPRNMPYRRPRFPAMRRPYIPRVPMRTPSAYFSSRGPATSYHHTTYQTRYARPYSRYTQNYRPVVYSSVARTPAVYRDVEMEIDTDDMMKNVAFYNRFDTGNDYIHMQSPYAKNRDDYYKVSDEFKLNGESFWMGDELEGEDGLLGAMMLGGLGAPAQTTVTVQSPNTNTMANAAALATANSAASYSNNFNNRVAANIPVNTIPVVTTNAQASVNGGVSGGQASAVAQTAASAAAASAAQATSAAQAAVSAAQSAASSAATSGTSSIIIPTKMDDDKGIMRVVGRNNLIQQGGSDLNSINTAVNAISNIVPTNTGTVVSPVIMGGKDMFDDKFGLLALNSLNTGLSTTNNLNTGLNVANNVNVQTAGTGSTNVFNDLGLSNNVVANTNSLLGTGGVTTTVTDTFLPPAFGFGDKFFGFKFD